MNNTTNCKGCHSDVEACKFISVHSKDKHDLDKCPCMMCLVKVVCTTPCEEYSMFSRVITENYELFIEYYTLINKGGIRKNGPYYLKQTKGKSKHGKL